MNRYLKIAALGSIVVLMLAVVLLRTLSSAAAVGSSTGTWNIVFCAKPSSSGGYLAGISAASASDIWTVGTYTPDSSPFQEGLIEHWDGTQWSVVPSPNPAGIGSGLSAVSAFSSNNAWAVGSYETANSVSLTLIEQWNGTQWSIVPSPNPGTFINELSGVVAISASDVWAVGIYGGPDSNPNPSGTLIEHWNGEQWSVVAHPTDMNGITTGATFAGIAGIPGNHLRSDAWTVGNYEPSGTTPIQTLIEHWNGFKWEIVGSPSPSTSENYLHGVTVITPDNAWAVGRYFNQHSGLYQTLVEHWNGGHWSVVTSPNANSTDSGLNSVAALSASDIWAVGDYLTNGDNGVYQTLIEHWDGKQWSIAASPNVGTNNNFLYAVTEVPTTQQAWAAGVYNDNLGGSHTLTETFC